MYTYICTYMCTYMRTYKQYQYHRYFYDTVVWSKNTRGLPDLFETGPFPRSRDGQLAPWRRVGGAFGAFSSFLVSFFSGGSARLGGLCSSPQVVFWPWNHSVVPLSIVFLQCNLRDCLFDWFFICLQLHELRCQPSTRWRMEWKLMQKSPCIAFLAHGQ